MLASCFSPGGIEAGCDEAGRGPLAGDLFAAAVILPGGFSHPLLDDSKKMSEKNRYLLRDVIRKQALAWSVARISPARIDEVNILNATFEGMNQAVNGLKLRPELLLVDGNRFKTELAIPYRCIVGGDAKFASIAAASVLAKTCRDDHMARLHAEFPEYNWLKNKGYPTRDHRAAIEKLGPSPYHRMSFRLL